MFPDQCRGVREYDASGLLQFVSILVSREGVIYVWCICIKIWTCVQPHHHSFLMETVAQRKHYFTLRKSVVLQATCPCTNLSQMFRNRKKKKKKNLTIYFFNFLPETLFLPIASELGWETLIRFRSLLNHYQLVKISVT